MSIFRGDLPYSKKRLEDLAQALGVDSAYLWVDPSNNAFTMRDISPLFKGKSISIHQTVDETDENDEVD